MAKRDVNTMLKDRFRATKSIDAMVKHFQEAVDEYHKGEWEKSLAKMGKCLEAALKALLVEAGLAVPTGRNFAVGVAIDRLGSSSTKGTVDDTVRLTIPRCCRFMYEVTSNRGGRHDANEVDANEMDATVVLSNCSWLVAEMVRYAQNSQDLVEAKEAVDALMTRRYPFFEDIEGRVYFDVKSAKSARDLGLLLLWQRGNKRIHKEQLIEAIRRQRRGVTRKNAQMAVGRLTNVVDDDGSGNLRMRSPGFREAEVLLAKVSS
ncbi:MAG: hypothetical protein AABM40_14890 [Chloroflexota bacterium]